MSGDRATPTGALRRLAALAWLLLAGAAPGAGGEPASAAVAPGQTGASSSRAADLVRRRQAKLAQLTHYEPGRLEKLLALFEDASLPDRALVAAFGVPVKRVKPRIGGQGAGAGTTFGASYEWLRQWHGRLDLSATALLSIRRYQTYSLRAALPRLMNGRLSLAAELRRRYRPADRFFGFGADASLEDESSFKLEDTALELSGSFRPERWSWLEIGTMLALVEPLIGRGRRAGVPSTEEIFDPEDVPGLGDQARYLRQEVWLEVDRRDQGYAQAGGRYRLSLARFDDRELDRFDFQRIELELAQYVPIVRGYQTLAFRFLTSLDAEREGHAVPFFLRTVLGGGNSLRGFPEFRFRDDNRLLLSAEYRWRLFAPLDAALFVDAGKVFDQREHLNFKDLRTAYGAGLRLHNSRRVLLRLDVGRSSEGVTLHVKLSHRF